MARDDERTSPARRWGRGGKPEEGPSEDELGWLADLRGARDTRAPLDDDPLTGPGTPRRRRPSRPAGDPAPGSPLPPPDPFAGDDGRPASPRGRRSSAPPPPPAPTAGRTAAAAPRPRRPPATGPGPAAGPAQPAHPAAGRRGRSRRHRRRRPGRPDLSGRQRSERTSGFNAPTPPPERTGGFGPPERTDGFTAPRLACCRRRSAGGFSAPERDRTGPRTGSERRAPERDRRFRLRLSVPAPSGPAGSPSLSARARANRRISDPERMAGPARPAGSRSRPVQDLGWARAEAPGLAAGSGGPGRSWVRAAPAAVRASAVAPTGRSRRPGPAPVDLVTTGMIKRAEIRKHLRIAQQLKVGTLALVAVLVLAAYPVYLFAREAARTR